MSRYVVFTFDDGRADQYFNAAKIMNKYGLAGTIFVTTGFVDGTMDREKVFLSSGGHAMTEENIRECIKMGIEIGTHADQHSNGKDDIQVSINKLNSWCGARWQQAQIGFASPSSDIWAGNVIQLRELKTLKYVRTGRQIKRNGYLYIFLFLINQICKSKRLFWHLNKRYINKPKKDVFLIESVAIRNDTPECHIRYCAEKIKDGECLVLLFHSVLAKDEDGYNRDCWYYDIQKFEKVCQYFSEQEYEVLTLTEAVDRLRKQGKANGMNYDKGSVK